MWLFSKRLALKVWVVVVWLLCSYCTFQFGSLPLQRAGLLHCWVGMDTICCWKPWVFLTKGFIHLWLAHQARGCHVFSFVLYAYLPEKE